MFLAEDDRLARRVAVKLLHTGLVGDDAFLRRFRAEARGAAALSNTNIVGVLDWGEDDDGPYLVLEYLGGGSLRDLLDAGHRLSVPQAAAVGLDVARGLSYAHRRGLVHRDIKPANLLFDEDGRLAIADFGLARALAEAAWTEPLGGLIGTVRYSSPEAAQGRSIDGRADIYALGLVLIESVSGRVPFRSDTTLATLMARVGSAPEIPAELGPLMPILADLTRIAPDERPDAGDLVRTLEGLLAKLPRLEPLPLVRPRVDADPTAPLVGGNLVPPLDGSPVAAGGERIGSGPAADVPAGAPRSRRRWPWLVVLLVVGLATGAFFVVRAITAVPRYRVPSLYELTPAEAAAQLAPGHFHLARIGTAFSATVKPGDVALQSPAAGVQAPRRSTIDVTLSKGPQPVAVPPVTNEPEATALARLKAVGLVPTVTTAYSETVTSGDVSGYNPSTGVYLPGTKVAVVVSMGPRPRIVPTFAPDTSYASAAASLAAERLISAKTTAYSNTVNSGDVIGSTPGAGATVQRGSTVTLTVSLGPHYVAVPNVYGESGALASQQLSNDGFQPHVYGPGGSVQLTDPLPGATVLYGSSITVIVL